jgi:hypothetical protein
VECFCECGNEPSGYIKCREAIEWLHNLWALEKSSASLSQLCEQPIRSKWGSVRGVLIPVKGGALNEVDKMGGLQWIP